MMPASRRKVLWLAIAVAGWLILVLLLRPAHQPPQAAQLRIAGQPQITNGAMSLNVVLSNGTPRTLNIVDDGMGKPFFVLDLGSNNLPGTIGTGLGTLANTLKLNLSPGDTLTNVVWVTNPPPRFRLLVEVRDLSTERRRAVAELFRYLAVKAGLRKQRASYGGSELLPASAWIEAGRILATDQDAAEPPTNGWSQGP